jgi:hypothetical protein
MVPGDAVSLVKGPSSLVMSTSKKKNKTYVAQLNSLDMLDNDVMDGVLQTSLEVDGVMVHVVVCMSIRMVLRGTDRRGYAAMSCQR